MSDNVFETGLFIIFLQKKMLLYQRKSKDIKTGDCYFDIKIKTRKHVGILQHHLLKN